MVAIVESSKEDRRICETCHQSNGRPLRRCKACLSVWYCSVECQRRDWKERHRRRCGRNHVALNAEQRTKPSATTTKVVDAWKELSGLLASASMDQLQHDYHMATDQAEKLRREHEGPRVDSESDVTEMNTVQKQTKKEPLRNFPAASSQEKEPLRVPEKSALLAGDKPLLLVESSDERQEWSHGASNVEGSNEDCFWFFYAEDLPNLGCQQLLLRPVNPVVRICLDDVTISLSPSENGGTLLSLCYGQHPELLLQIPLTCVQQSPRIYAAEDNRALQIRLTYAPESEKTDTAQVSPSLLRPGQAEGVACRSCHQRLFLPPQGKDTGGNKSSAIRRVLPLPSGRWDDMGDYLSCYEGQPAVDFGLVTTTAAQKHIFLEDEVVLVAHKDDVGKNVCVFSWIGYGEDSGKGDEDREEDDKAESSYPDKDLTAVFRGSRPWREAVGGATVTCSFCASVLGFAPVDMPDTYRLLKHQLCRRSGDETQRGADFVPLQTLASFVTHEMVRYAETKAIFTFVVVNCHLASRHGRSRRNLLLLRLLNWDGTATSIHDSSTRSLEDGSTIYSLPRRWNRIAKVLFEETVEEGHTASSESPLAMWTESIDWCCLPKDASLEPSKQDSGDRPVTSMVRLYLTDSEWNLLRTELQDCSRFYAREVVEATVLAKTGRKAESLEKVGIAAIPLR